MRRVTMGVVVAAAFLAACVTTETSAPADDDSGTDVGGMGPSPTANSDGDLCGLTDLQEVEMGLDPNALDSDLDGFNDCDEIACVSNPADVNQQCYACGWEHNDPGTLVATGAAVGDVINNIGLVDQCGELVNIWDFYGKYHILWMTAAW